MTEFADILIIGAGPAGMAAALAAESSGARIVLLDDNPNPGGQIWRDGPQAHLPAEARQMRERLRAYANVHCHVDTRVIANAAEKTLLVENAEQGWLIAYDRLILCTGARELLLPFPGWTLPGVTGAGGLQALVKGGLPVRSERLVIAGSGPLLLASAATARHHGAQVLRIAEQASRAAVASFAAKLPRWPGKLWQSFSLFDAHYRTGTHVLEALGRDKLEGVRLLQQGKTVELACDRLACGFGLIPNTQLGQALCCALDGQALAVDEFQATTRDDHYAAGECTGFGGSELALVEGAIAGYAAVGNSAAAQQLWPRRVRWQGFARALNQAFALDGRLKSLARGDTLVCRCEDVPYEALSGHTDWREAKLASRCGMGACQGRVCGAALEHLFGWKSPVPRPPFSPALVETLIRLEDASSG
ncbi:NAD(P)/FAD-dependent oxidoreductase [Pseudomonas brassicacearum]|uniref:NAD(P)/FAD-dependent oxidoreductase n=1 Tax=Pseudomonas brassicacearum subsp. neoaurantiaca TaxID=494916 RepID=A0A7V8RLK7_9PSED|nr:FAD/NAD(P)-binding oxidoreductase [Pseudomonas brassicacearum]MBA1378762.1 NAD(P)/FAD-dependent oxidoreductase [Pseudomonas brassicacearum subsp. neoaurantiaca]